MRIRIVGPFLGVAALIVSLFFFGTNLVVFSAALGLQIAALAIALWHTYREPARISCSALTISIALLWLWLAVTLLWTPVPFVSITMFWWLSALPLAFWSYTLQPVRVWPWFAVPILTVGWGLALTGTYQLLVQREVPQSGFLDVNIQAAILVLIALPTGGYFLQFGTSQRRSGRATAFLGLSFLLLTYGAMLTRSRGGLLAFFIGMALLLIIAARHVPKKLLIAYASLVALAIFLADLSWSGALSGRVIDTFMDPHGASAQRFAIWHESWRLLFEQSPFRGIGLGLYSLVWPPYRAPEDASAGFFVHNDYLQFWIEAGLPGLLLMLAVLASTAWIVWRALRHRELAGETRIEMAGLFAGLAAIAAHSTVQYNFYIIPILLISGVVLARLQELASPIGGATARGWRWQPGRYFSVAGYRFIAIAVALVPLGYFAAIGASSYCIVRSNALVQEGRIEEAEHALLLAQRLWPSSDAPRFARAALYRRVLAADTGQLSVETRQSLFRDAEELLAEAERRNPYRAQVFLIRGDLYALGPALAGAAWRQKAEQGYRRAFALEPRFYRARYAYGRLLLDRGETSQAQAILEDGMRYQYAESSDIVPYYVLVALLRERAGDHAGAQAMQERIGYYVGRPMNLPAPPVTPTPRNH